MLPEAKLRTLPEPCQTYQRKAQKFVEASGGDWQWILPGMPEWDAWMAYYKSLKWKPFGVKQVDQGNITGITVPAMMPDWFDSGYIPTNRTAMPVQGEGDDYGF